MNLGIYSIDLIRAFYAYSKDDLDYDLRYNPHIRSFYLINWQIIINYNMKDFDYKEMNSKKEKPGSSIVFLRPT